MGKGTIVIRMTTGVFYGLILSMLGIVALIGVFWVGLRLGSSRPAGPVAPRPAYSPGQPYVIQPAAPQPVAPVQQPQVAAADQTVPGPAGPPAGSEVPIGDNPRLALPELAGSNYALDFGRDDRDARASSRIRPELARCQPTRHHR